MITSLGWVTGALALLSLGSLGYRQLLTAWRVLGLVDVARGRRGWGEMRRRGLGYAPARGESRGR